MSGAPRQNPCTICFVDRLYRTVVQLEEAKRLIEQGDVAPLRAGSTLSDLGAPLIRGVRMSGFRESQR